MNDRPVMPEPPAGGGDLQDASGIAGRNDVGLERGDVARLPFAELPGRLRLHEIVDAGAAAADLRFRRRQQLDSRNRGEQRPRLRAHALRVREVTGIVIHDARLDRMPRRTRLADLDEQLRYVTYLCAERAGPRRPG